jgi:4-hydroxy-2-oxoheptanedioate aldolase
VPNIGSREETVAAAAAMRYPPVGLRGGFGRSRAAGYGIPQSQAEYFTKMNDEVLFLPLIEDQSALDQLDGICSVEGVDIVLIGPGDLALSMGIPGGWSAPAVQEEVERIRAAAERAGKPAMIVALDAADGRRLHAQGFQVLQASAVALFAGAARSFLDELQRG